MYTGNISSASVTIFHYTIIVMGGYPYKSRVGPPPVTRLGFIYFFAGEGEGEVKMCYYSIKTVR